MSRVFALLFSGRSSLDSFADRLNCRITVCILLVIAVLAMVRAFISEPIRCFAPSQFTTSQAAFAEQACWLSATYHLPTDALTSSESASKSSRGYAAFYRWLPLILAFQAFFFYLPKLFWNLTSSISGSINVLHIASSQTQHHDPNAAAQNVQYMAKCLGRHLDEFDKQWKKASSGKSVWLKFWLLLRGNCTCVFYIVVKLMYIFNCLLQLILINGFLGGGRFVLDRLRSGTLEDPDQTEYPLPRRILCEVDIRNQSSVDKYILNCSLPLNFWYEIVFLFLWSWLLFVFLATIWSLICFVISMVNIFYQDRYCRLRVLALSKDKETESIPVSKFVREFLTRDSWFIVQKVGVISGDQTATELVCGLWENYVARKLQQPECANLTSSSDKINLSENESSL